MMFINSFMMSSFLFRISVTKVKRALFADPSEKRPQSIGLLSGRRVNLREILRRIFPEILFAPALPIPIRTIE
jgi:hypothetical protein